MSDTEHEERGEVGDEGADVASSQLSTLNSQLRRPRVLVAGIGNIFLGDDGFGVEVARRLMERALPDGVHVVDFGIRGLDLAYALLEEREAVILVDAAPCGQAPGTLSLIEPQVDPAGPVALDAHGMDPVKVLALARTLGAPPVRTLLLACEPQAIVDAAAGEEMTIGLSAPVAAVVETAVDWIEALLGEMGGETE